MTLSLQISASADIAKEVEPNLKLVRRKYAEELKETNGDIVDQYEKAVNEYNEALSTGNEKDIEKTLSAYTKVKETVDSLLGEEGNQKYSFLFDSVQVDQFAESFLGQRTRTDLLRPS